MILRALKFPKQFGSHDLLTGLPLTRIIKNSLQTTNQFSMTTKRQILIGTKA